MQSAIRYLLLFNSSQVQEIGIIFTVINYGLGHNKNCVLHP